jgi:hypothetical protein
MKRNLLLACFGLFLMSGLFGQEPNINFTYKVDSTSINNEVQYNITITLTTLTTPVIYELFDKSPDEGGKSLQYSGVTNSTKYTFTNVSGKRNYLVYVYNENKNYYRGKKIIISNPTKK